ncbi:hypothetical protein EVJ58_g2175 [Rhodofomes roseus]|uniref:Uncharacterized protein n=1 Tax=Rhodofomes roseus TaxID=34475 RepID=A0A4Y9YRT0_9APHY|nr:hypothetical protein EVJ58_g2175 [Rhodofomes roseus]
MRQIHATSVPHTDGNASDGSIHADVSSAVPPHDATPDAGVTLTVGTAGAREEDGAHMHSTQKDYGISQPEKSGVAEPTVPSVEDATKRESLANPIPRDEPTIPMSRRFPTDSSSSRPSLGDRFSSITLAHASLQYFKDRAQSACKAYLPSPLRQSVLASSAQAEATAFDVGAIEAQGEALDAVSSSATSSASGAWVKASTTVDAAGDASPRIHEDVVSSEAPLPAVPGSSGFGCLDDSALHTATFDEVPGRALSPAFDPVPFTLSEPQVEVPAVDLSPAPVSSSVAEFAASDSVSPLAPMEASPTICALSIIDAPSSALSAAPDPSLPAPSAEPDPSLSALSASLPTSLGSYPSAVLPCAAAPSAVLTVPAIIVSGPSDDAPAILADGHNASSELNEEPAVGEESNSPQAHFLEHACPSDSALSANATSAIPQAPAASHNLAPLGENVAGVEDRDVDWRMSLAFDEAVEKNPHILIPDGIPVPPPIVSEDMNAASTLVTDIDAPAAAVQSCLSPPSTVFDFAGDPLATNALPDCSQAVHHLEMPSAVLEVTEDPEDTVLPGSTPNELSMLSNMPAVSSDGSTRSKSEGFSVVPAAGETVHGDKSTDETKAQVSLESSRGASAATIEVLEGISVHEDELEAAMIQEGTTDKDEDMMWSDPLASTTDALHTLSPNGVAVAPATMGAVVEAKDATATTASGADECTAAEDTSCTAEAEANAMLVDPAVQSSSGYCSLPSDYALVDVTAGSIPHAAPSAIIEVSYVHDDAQMLDDDGVYHPAEASVEMPSMEHDFADDSFVPASSPLPSSSPPFLSSPLRSSSPPCIFSSPPRAGFNSSPPSSPVPDAKPRKAVSFSLDDECRSDREGNSKTAQKKRALEDIFASDDEELDAFTQDGEKKRVKLEPVMASMSSLPQPKRPTLASQLRQRKKLIAPFRSPLVDKDAARHGIDAVYASGKSSTGLAATKREATEMPADSVSTGTQAGSSLSQTVKDYPPSVAKQFKSPLHLGSSGPPSATVSSVQAIPTIRALQAKIQTLKQAIRIKTASDGNDEEELDELVVKWTTVGREVAWAVWDTVKDLGPGETANIGKVGGGWFDDERSGRDGGHNSGWGFDDASQPAKGEMGDEGGGSGTKEVDDDAPGVQHTVGTMLRHLGIAPETLGWDEEEEGDFVDVE